MTSRLNSDQCAYCAADQTIYYSTAWAPDDPSAEILWWTVLGHEWGHHIQGLTDTGIGTVLDAELQGDCFSGAFLNYAKDAGLVSPLALTLATGLTQSAAMYGSKSHPAAQIMAIKRSARRHS